MDMYSHVYDEGEIVTIDKIAIKLLADFICEKCKSYGKNKIFGSDELCHNVEKIHECQDKLILMNPNVANLALPSALELDENRSCDYFEEIK